MSTEYSSDCDFEQANVDWMDISSHSDSNSHYSDQPVKRRSKKKVGQNLILVLELQKWSETIVFPH